jgi:hypothetical protein
VSDLEEVNPYQPSLVIFSHGAENKTVEKPTGDYTEITCKYRVTLEPQTPGLASTTFVPPRPGIISSCITPQHDPKPI